MLDLSPNKRWNLGLKAAVVAAALLFLCGDGGALYAGQAAQGEVEPNGTSATATPLAGTNLVVRANLTPNGDGVNEAQRQTDEPTAGGSADPTPIAVDGAAVIPTLSPFGLFALALALAALAVALLRRRLAGPNRP